MDIIFGQKHPLKAKFAYLKSILYIPEDLAFSTPDIHYFDSFLGYISGVLFASELLTLSVCFRRKYPI